MENNPGGTISSRNSIARNPMDSTIPPHGASSRRNQLTGRTYGSVSQQVKKIHLSYPSPPSSV
jgi:hypothetical protein